MATTPIGVYNSDAFPYDYPLGYIYLHTAFMQLPKPTQKLFLETMVFAEGGPIMERIYTNAFSGEVEGASHFLMYPETAKMNHDCRPNAMSYYDPKTLIHATQASRTILLEEEITIYRISISYSREKIDSKLSRVLGGLPVIVLSVPAPPPLHTSAPRTPGYSESYSCRMPWWIGVEKVWEVQVSLRS